MLGGTDPGEDYGPRLRQKDYSDLLTLKELRAHPLYKAWMDGMGATNALGPWGEYNALLIELLRVGP